jgi:murein DD-endopeptidase MepM/ murein hydrolase activator NlpD
MGHISNTFGMVRTHKDGTPKPHQGWDFFAPFGTTCYAIGQGKVVYLNPASGDFGMLLITSFKFRGQQLFAAYAHLSRALVKLHDTVEIGTPICETGNSGNAFNLHGGERHLHFEVRQIPTPGKGLEHRIDPIRIFDICPLHQEIYYVTRR